MLHVGRLLRGRPFDDDGWKVIEEATAHFRPWERTREYLREDEGRIAAATDRDRLLSGLGFKWGQRVARGYVSAAEAYYWLCQGAARWGDDAALERGQDTIKQAMFRGMSSIAWAG